MFYLLNILLLFSLLKDEDHISLALQIPSRQISRRSVVAPPNTYTAPSLAQVYSHSSNSASGNLMNNRTNTTAIPTATLPTPVYSSAKSAGASNSTKGYAQIKSQDCSLKELYCSSKYNNGTTGNANTMNIDDPCLLWDPSCSGNRTWAIDTFFDPTFQQDLLNNTCFVAAGSLNSANASTCATYNPPARIAEFQKIKDWMRSQQCASAAAEWAAESEPLDPSSQEAVAMDPHRYHIASDPDPSCCGVCQTEAKNVELFYWPEPDANTSCLSIIGDDVRPVDFGATTTSWSVGTITSALTYWGCKPGVSTFYDTLHSASVTYTDEIKTAVITTIGPLTVKVYASDPWSPSPCTQSDGMSQGSNKSAQIRDRHAPMHARGHTLVVPSSVTQADSLPVTTVVSGNFTFTSPSIYANFHGIQATDQCGGVVISSTMIAFAPGELATIAGPLATAVGDGVSAWKTKTFDFKDLPCPPQSVMEENWYKPQPGEPYRPLIALPGKLKELVPWLSHCDNQYFTAYDPPSALKPASALAGPNSPNNAPAPPPLALVPTSTTLEAGAIQTGNAEASVPVPANVPTLNQPMATNTAASAPTEQNGPDPETQPNDHTVQQSSPPQPQPVTPPTNNNPAVQESPQLQPQPEPVTPPANNDPEGGNRAQQASDPNNYGGNNDGKSGQQEDPNPNNSPNQVNNAQGPNENAGQVPQNNPQQTQGASPFENHSEGQAITINNVVAQPLSNGISIASTTLTRGASPITVSGIPIHYDSSALIVGTSTVPLAPEVPAWTMKDVFGQGNTEAPIAAPVAGMTLTPGSPGIQPAGTFMSLDDGGQLMFGSKTISLASASQNPIATNIENQGMSAAPNGIIPIAGDSQKTPDASNDFVDKGTPVSLNTAGQLIVGSKTITLPQNGRSSAGLGGLIMGGFNTGGPSSEGEEENPLVNTVNGQVITASGPTALAMAVTALTPGASGLTINGVAVSLNTASQLVVGSSRTIPLSDDEGKSAGGFSYSSSSEQQTTAADLAAGSMTTTGEASGSSSSSAGLPQYSGLPSSTALPTGTTTQSDSSSITGGAVSSTRASVVPISHGNALSIRRRGISFVSWRDFTSVSAVAISMIVACIL